MVQYQILLENAGHLGGCNDLGNDLVDDHVPPEASENVSIRWGSPDSDVNQKHGRSIMLAISMFVQTTYST